MVNTNTDEKYHRYAPVFVLFMMGRIAMKRFLKFSLYAYLFLFLYVSLLRGITIEPKIDFNNVYINIIPFDFIWTIISVSNGVLQSGYNINDYIPTIIWDNIHGFIYNVLLFIPFGILVPLVYEKYHTLKKIIVTGMIVSFAKEVLKIIISFLGLAYGRSFRIDNIIASFLGTLLGYLILSIFNFYTTKKIRDYDKVQ